MILKKKIYEFNMKNTSIKKRMSNHANQKFNYFKSNVNYFYFSVKYLSLQLISTCRSESTPFLTL